MPLLVRMVPPMAGFDSNAAEAEEAQLLGDRRDGQRIGVAGVALDLCSEPVDPRAYIARIRTLRPPGQVDFVRAVFRNGGLGEKVTWEILPTVQRRRLRGKARREAEARAEGRRAGKEQGT